MSWFLKDVGTVVMITQNIDPSSETREACIIDMETGMTS